jgi:hypothetical protein
MLILQFFWNLNKWVLLVWCGVLVTIEVLFFQLIGVPFSRSVTLSG